MGFFKVDNRVIDTLKFDDGVEGFVFIVLSRYCNNDKTAYPAMENLMEKCNCSKSKMINVLKKLEEKGYIFVTRKPLWSNRYRINPMYLPKTPQGVSETPHGLPKTPNKEKHIKNNIKESVLETESQTPRKVALKELHKLIAEATGVNIFRVEQSFTGRGLTLEKILELTERIKHSDFLLGKQVKKPDLRHFSKIDKILSTYYDNGGGKKSEPLPSYYQKFPKTGVTYYEPLD